MFYFPIAKDKSDLRKPVNLAFGKENSVGKNTFLYKEVPAYSSWSLGDCPVVLFFYSGLLGFKILSGLLFF